MAKSSAIRSLRAPLALWDALYAEAEALAIKPNTLFVRMLAERYQPSSAQPAQAQAPVLTHLPRFLR